ncbi:hypothetical protein THMIRHAS_08360 [Thiosulfatimonas sediminis]|uniref:Transposase n=1 Tax=Thiosulfatimonas sediminis TaxID=2675054 RepID=A0A6F8PTJ9_9GAMM|nr:hypothetical protein [Thiosulfatimonas sediminis]BBP44640.1 hypothetical protein THMIRHAS_00130 [Thiosulfatimonas sediminis]BBP45463.1 hypothetical protein THMIRHAS_08360 [Thiosulfatimonas sediminis]
MSKHELWVQRIADWQASGLSQRAFCQQQGLAISTFYTWRRRLRNLSQEPIKESSAFLPMVIHDQPEPCSTSIAVKAKGLVFECSVVQLAQLITELNRHA